MAETVNHSGIATFQTAGFWHLIAGIIMIILGLYVWFNPVASLLGLALYLGIAFIVVGAGYFLASFSYRSGWYLVVGLLDIFVGVIFVSNLGVSAATLPIIFALWCLAVGVVQLANSFELRRDSYAWGWTMGIGILGILFAFLILVYPAIGAITITTLMGLYIILYGAFAIAEYIYTPHQTVTVQENYREK